MSLIFVDCEGHGPAPGPLHDPDKFEFGAVEFKTRQSFHGIGADKIVFEDFLDWLHLFPSPYVFTSDNCAYDFQFINYYCHLFLGYNPFGHSARRISDFYAGLMGDWRKTQDWKRWRKTKHDHHPVHDSIGNCEAFEKILEIERSIKEAKKAAKEEK